MGKLRSREHLAALQPEYQMKGTFSLDTIILNAGTSQLAPCINQPLLAGRYAFFFLNHSFHAGLIHDELWVWDASFRKWPEQIRRPFAKQLDVLLECQHVAFCLILIVRSWIMANHLIAQADTKLVIDLWKEQQGMPYLIHFPAGRQLSSLITSLNIASMCLIHFQAHWQWGLFITFWGVTSHNLIHFPAGRKLFQARRPCGLFITCSSIVGHFLIHFQAGR